MAPRIARIAACVAFLGILSVLALGTGEARADSADSCIKFWGEARYAGLGYNHLVHVANACGAAADCTVTTDVNPEEQKLSVAGKSEALVNTFMGSPARVFTPHVKCVMHDR